MLELTQTGARGSGCLNGTANVLNLLTEIPRQPYSYGMISEFQELSDKIDLLAELTLALRRENAALRQSNASLTRENQKVLERMSEVQLRVEQLLGQLPEQDDGEAADNRGAQ